MKNILFFILFFYQINFPQNIDPILVSNTRTITFTQASTEFNEYHNDISSYIRNNTWIQNEFSITWPNPMVMYRDTQWPGNSVRDRTQYTANMVSAYARAARVETNIIWRNQYLDLAQRGAEFLLCMQSQNTGGGVVFAPSDLTDDNFATGVTGVAFVECYLTFGNDLYKNAAINLAEWALNNPTYPHNWPGEPYKFYSNVNHHARMLYALAAIYSITGDQRYIDRCFQICEEIIAWQNFTDTRDGHDISLRTGAGNTWEDGGWYWYDYSPTSLPDAYTDINGGSRDGFCYMRAVTYNGQTLESLIKTLEVINQHTLPGTTTLRNSSNFQNFKNNLATSIINGTNYLINLQEQTNLGNQRRGYFSSFTGDIYFDSNLGYVTRSFSAPNGLATVIDSYLSLLRAKVLSTQDVTRLQTLILSLADHYESNVRTTTGWGLAEWYTDGMLLNWSKYMLYRANEPYSDDLTLVNNGFEDDELRWELWSWDGSGVEVYNSVSRTGNNSIHIVDNNSNASKWASMLIDATPGITYQATGYLLLNSGYQAIRLHFLDANLNELQYHYNNRSASGSWQYAAIQGTAPANTAFLRVILYSAWSHTSNGYWDDISLNILASKTSASAGEINGTNELFTNSLRSYPNPFNPLTNINYTIDSPGIVQLKVYNSIGQEVATLVNRFQEAGNYEVQFNGSYLPSGVYLCRINHNNFSHTQKIILTK